MRRNFTALIVLFGWLILILLASCQTVSDVGTILGLATSTATLSQRVLYPTATNTPQSTLFFTPTSLPTETAVSSTPFPTEEPPSQAWSSQILDSTNITNLTRLANYGKGDVQSYSDNGAGIVVAKATTGVYFYNWNDPSGSPVLIASFADAGSYTPSPDWSQVLIVEANHTLDLVNTIDGSIKFTFNSTVEIPDEFPPEYSQDTIDKMIKEYYLVTGIAFSTDGAWVAVSYGDGSIGIWSTQDGSLRNRLASDTTGPSMTMSFSPDNTILACYNQWNNTLSSWNISDGTLLWHLSQAGRLADPAFSPDGTILATYFKTAGAAMDDVVLRKTTDGTEIGSDLGSISQGAFSADSTMIAISHLKDVKLVQIVPSFSIVKTIHTDLDDPAARLEVIDGETRLVLNDLQVWSITDYTLIGDYTVSQPAEPAIQVTQEEWGRLHHLGGLFDVTTTTDQGIYLFGGRDQSQYSTSQIIWRWQPSTDQIEWADFQAPILNIPVASQDGNLVAGCTNDSLKIYNFTEQTLTRYMYAVCTKDTQTAFSPDGKTFVSTELTKINQFTLADGVLQHTLRGHTYAPDALTYSRNGSWLISASNQSVVGPPAVQVLLWDMEHIIGIPLSENSYTGPDLSFSFTMDNAYVFSDTARRWALEDGSILYLRWDYSPVDLETSPVSDLLISVESNGLLHVYNFAGSEEVSQFDTHLTITDPTTSYISQVIPSVRTGIRFSQDGKNLIFLLANGTVDLWGIN